MAFSCNGLFYHPARDEFFKPEQFGLRAEDVAITSGDGTRLHGWLLEAARPSPCGVVVHFHGNAENLTSHFSYFAWMPPSGYRLLAFDYRGYGRSDGVPTRAGTVLDGKAAIEYAISIAGDAPVFVIGQSLGGAVATASVGTLSPATREKVRALVLESSFASYRAVARKKLGQLWLTWPMQYPLSFLITDELSPEDFAPALHLPTVVIHARDDLIVPFSEGEALAQSFGPGKADFWILEKGGHTAAFVRESDPWRAKLLTFLASAGGATSSCSSLAPVPVP